MVEHRFRIIFEISGGRGFKSLQRLLFISWVCFTPVHSVPYTFMHKVHNGSDDCGKRDKTEREVKAACQPIQYNKIKNNNNNAKGYCLCYRARDTLLHYPSETVLLN